MPSAVDEKLTRKFVLNVDANPFIPGAPRHESSTSAHSTRSEIMPMDQYQEFAKYLLTREELKRYGFPVESPDQPGRVAMSAKMMIPKGCKERTCCRCGISFNITQEGCYESQTTCHYHTQKQTPYREGRAYYGKYLCCNGDYKSEGCRTCQYHVTAQIADDVEFVKTENVAGAAGVVYALDCEMVYTTAGMEVAKVCVVDVNDRKLYESFVQPQNDILDLNTDYSGITEQDLNGVTTRLWNIQRYLLKLLNQESILVGHGLENDLKALRLIHYKIVDTSIVYISKNTKRLKLKHLAREFLHKEIQHSAEGHNCLEDARTCMELMLHRIKSDKKNQPTVIQEGNRNFIMQNISYLPTLFMALLRPFSLWV